MKVYKVKVNGKVYEVELESVSESAQSIVAPVQSAPVEQPAQPVVAPAGNAEGAELVAPMAGTILDVKVKVGQSVNVGDVVCILEAMKLENDVVANASGVIKAIQVNKGDSVEVGRLIAVIG